MPQRQSREVAELGFLPSPQALSQGHSASGRWPIPRHTGQLALHSLHLLYGGLQVSLPNQRVVSPMEDLPGFWVHLSPHPQASAHRRCLIRVSRYSLTRHVQVARKLTVSAACRGRCTAPGNLGQPPRDPGHLGHPGHPTPRLPSTHDPLAHAHPVQ